MYVICGTTRALLIELGNSCIHGYAKKTVLRMTQGEDR